MRDCSKSHKCYCASYRAAVAVCLSVGVLATVNLLKYLCTPITNPSLLPHSCTTLLLSHPLPPPPSSRPHRRTSTRPAWEPGSPSSGRPPRLPTTASSPSRATSGALVSCLLNSLLTAGYLIPVSVWCCLEFCVMC